jgi:hypothetical protein
MTCFARKMQLLRSYDDAISAIDCINAIGIDTIQFDDIDVPP